MTVCTCGVCVVCQLADLELTQAADLLLLDPFVAVMEDRVVQLDRLLADAFGGGAA